MIRGSNTQNILYDADDEWIYRSADCDLILSDSALTTWLEDTEKA